MSKSELTYFFLRPHQFLPVLLMSGTGEDFSLLGVGTGTCPSAVLHLWRCIDRSSIVTHTGLSECWHLPTKGILKYFSLTLLNAQWNLIPDSPRVLSALPRPPAWYHFLPGAVSRNAVIRFA